MTAGRCLDADGSGFGSARVMAICVTMGQGAGTGAALSLKHGYDIPEMDFEALRRTLTERGAVVDFDNAVTSAEPVEYSKYPVSWV